MGIEPPSPHIQVDTSRQVDKSTSRQVDNVDNDRQGTHVVTINLESTTSTMVDKELTTHRQLTVDNWSTMVDKVDKLSTRIKFDKVDKQGSREFASPGDIQS